MYHSNNRVSRYGTPNRDSRFSRSARPRRRFQQKEDINIEHYIRKAQAQHQTPAIQPQHTVTRTFADFALDSRLQAQIISKGYVDPTPVQDKCLEPILAGRDVLGIANTGTGKTAAFLIPMIHHMLQTKGYKAFVITPTRELALQIEQEFRSLTRGLGFYTALCIGGTSMFRQRQTLMPPVDLLIGTPGRLKDLVNRQVITLSQYQVVVLDEVDRMLDMGFVPDIRMLLGRMLVERQSLFFSATVTPVIESLIHTFSRDLARVSVKATDTSHNISQDVVKVAHGSNKVEVLHQLLIRKEVEKVLVFGRTKYGVRNLTRSLTSRGFRVDDIHGNKSQPQRQRALHNFRNNRINILVATDVAARGLDIADVTHVINYDIPATFEDYIHRIGRTGRADKKGTALTLVDQPV